MKKLFTLLGLSVILLQNGFAGNCSKDSIQLRYNMITRKFDHTGTSMNYIKFGKFVDIEVYNANKNAFAYKYEINRTIHETKIPDNLGQIFQLSDAAKTIEKADDNKAETDKELKALKEESWASVLDNKVKSRKSPAKIKDDAEQQAKLEQLVKLYGKTNDLTTNSNLLNDRLKKYNDLQEQLNGLLSSTATTKEIMDQRDLIITKDKLYDSKDENDLNSLKTSVETGALDIKTFIEYNRKALTDVFPQGNKVSLDDIYTNVSTLYDETRKLNVPKGIAAVKNSYNKVGMASSYSFHLEEFRATDDLIDIKLQYAGLTDTNTKGQLQYKDVALPTFKIAGKWRIGYGGGPGMLYIPGLKSYTKVTASKDSLGNVDSVYLKEGKDRKPVSLAIASVVDISYQFTPGFSLGAFFGVGVDVGKELNGNLYAGLSLGIFTYNNMKAALNIGAGFAKADVLKKEYENDVHYKATEVADEYTEKKIKAGLFFGLTISGLTNPLNKK